MSEIVAFANVDLVKEEIVEEQISLVDSASLYNRINDNFRNEVLEPVFAKEHFDLFTWRRNLFEKSLGDSWVTSDNDDLRRLETIDYQVTVKFDEFVDIMAYHWRYIRTPDQGKIYFERCTSSVEQKYDPVFIREEFEFWLDTGDRELCEFGFSNLSFSDWVYILIGCYQDSPLRLEHIAYKKVLAENLSTDCLPKILKEKLKRFFHPSIHPPNCLSSEGRTMYEKLTME